jgi:hypothetical protein
VSCHRLAVFIGVQKIDLAIFVKRKFAHLYDIFDVHLAQVVFLAAITQHIDVGGYFPGLVLTSSEIFFT